MKSIAFAAGLVLASNGAFAGTVVEPVVEPTVVPVEPAIVEPADTGSNAAWFVPLVAIALIGAVVATREIN